MYAAMTKDEAQHSIRTFYEAVKKYLPFFSPQVYNMDGKIMPY
jgi:hypothetical protein